MTLEEMETRAITCAGHPLNHQDIIVVEEIWLSTIEICARLDRLAIHTGAELYPVATPVDIANLRHKTGRSMKDCKEALIRYHGNSEAAIEFLGEV